MAEPDQHPAEEPNRLLPVLASAGGEPAAVVVDPEAEARPVDRLRVATLPAPLVAATGGFLAGVVSFVAVTVLRGRGRRRALARRRRFLEREIAGSRSFLVDVHLLKR